jgi:hypothetical protein
MKTITTERGFRIIEHWERGLVQESSSIGPYEDSMDNPGSSFLWVGEEQSYHLDREEVLKLINCLQYWLDNKRLPVLVNDEA